MTLLSDIELRNKCLEIRDLFVDRRDYYASYIDFLYKNGSRPSEALRSDYILGESGDQYILQPDKNNLTRLVDFDLVNKDMVNYYLNDSKYLRPQQYEAISNRFQKMIFPTGYRIDNKELGMYIFRYNYVRTLNSLGYTIAEIKIKMGWNTNGIAERYINSKIYEYNK